MKKELVKELQKAQFWHSLGQGYRDSGWWDNSIPTLSELIEACATTEMYFGLEKHSNDWRAGTLKTGGMNHMVSASTPEEAVAKLWLALHPSKQ